MKRASFLLHSLLCVFIMATAAAPVAFAQSGGTTAPLTGVVSDTSGGVLVGAGVVVKNNATAAEYRTVTDANGRFVVPALNPGTYTVTISMNGFKTLVLPDVPLTTATPASVTAVLEPGGVAETVVVQGGYDLVQTQTAAVQLTMVVQQVQGLPLMTNNSLDLVGGRSSVINGMPNVTINITLDGINVQDNYGRTSDGFFAYIRPVLESVEEITVSSSTPGAESAGQGATQIRMTTRKAPNVFSGAVYNTWRNQAGTNDEDALAREHRPGWLWRLNTPYWFNKRDRPKTAAGDYFIDDVRLQMPGFRLGGPIVVPHLLDGRDKAFFFFNWEWFLYPVQTARTRYLLNSSAQNGLFTYPAADGSGNKTVDILALAASKGFPSTVDPVVGKLLADIRSSAAGWTAGGLSSWDLNNDKFDYNPSGNQRRHFPTLRLDVNLTQRHQLSFTARYNRFESRPDFLNGLEPTFPGFANTGGQFSNRHSGQVTLRSTLSANLVNEAHVGYAGGKTQFWPEVSASQFDCTGLGCQGGYNLLLGGTTRAVGTTALTPATAYASQSSRSVPDYGYEDTLFWIRGNHTMSMGASLTQIKFNTWDNPGYVVPRIAFGVAPAGPYYNTFTPTSGNFPGGISTTYAGYARNLYALLVGNVNQLYGTAVLGTDGQYHYLGDRTQKGHMNDLGMFVTDSWRLRPNLTVTGGLRWELQFPFQSDLVGYSRLERWTDVYGITGEGNMFKPGTMTGRTPEFAPYAPGEQGYNMDWNNVAPSIGIAWRPHVGAGWLGRILGRDPVFRGGYSISYTRQGTSDFQNIYGANPGSTRDMTRRVTLGNLETDVLLRETSRLQPPPVPDAPSYPFSPESSETVAVMDPNLKVPMAHQYSIGWQREFGKVFAIEVRYIGNRYVGAWTNTTLTAAANRFTIENGFLDEFKSAQQNLQANIAAGKGNTFAYTGITGTSPLPIFLAHFSGLPASQAGDPAKYTASQFKSASFYNLLSLYDPQIATITGVGSNGLQYVNLRSNMLKAGLPENFWMANPDVADGVARLRYNGGTSRYDGLQVEVRQRMSKGLLVMGNYGFSRAYTFDRDTLRNDFYTRLSDSNVDHAVSLSWVYDLPFGPGRQWGSGATGWRKQIASGWEWTGMGRIQSGLMVDFPDVRLVGMTDGDLQDMFKIYRVKDEAGLERIYMLPQDVIEQSIIALNNALATSPTGWSGPAPTGRYIARPSTPDCVQVYSGQCSPAHHYMRGPWITGFDMAFVKRFPIGEKMNIEARMDLFNVFNAVNFIPVAGLGSTLSGWEVTAASSDVNMSQYPGGRMTQFGLRFTW